MKRDIELDRPANEPMAAVCLLELSSAKYWARLTTAHGLYHADDWKVVVAKDGVMITLMNAKIRDSQGRDWVTKISKLETSPEIHVPVTTMVTVIGERAAFHTPLPRGCSLYLEQK